MNYIESVTKLIIVGVVIYFASLFITLDQFIALVIKAVR